MGKTKNKDIKLKNILEAGFVLHSSGEKFTTYKAKKGYILQIYPSIFNGEVSTMMELYKGSFFNMLFKSRVETMQDFEWLMKTNKVWE